MKRPRVSVVLPVLNGMPYLRDAIRSIVDQTYTDLELVVIDSGSTDGSLELARGLEDPRMRLIVPERRLSLPLVHAFGVARSDGELVALMGQDDVSRPTRLARQVAMLDAQPEVALVGCWAAMIDAAGARVGAVRYAASWPRLRRGLIRNNQIVPSSMLVRRAAYDVVGGFTEDCGYAFDYDLVMRVARVARVANVADELHEYRYNPMGASVHGVRTAQRGALRARWRELRRGGHPPADWLWLLKPLLALALPGPILRAIVVPYMRAVHGRAAPPRH